MVSKFAFLLIIIAAIMIISTVLQFLRHKITRSWTIFWIGLWVVGTLGVVFSGFMDRIGEYVIGGEGRFLVIYLAIIVLFFLGYRLFLAVQRNNAALSKLVEELAKKK
jgi:hypothetical protein